VAASGEGGTVVAGGGDGQVVAARALYTAYALPAACARRRRPHAPARRYVCSLWRSALRACVRQRRRAQRQAAEPGRTT